MQMVEEGERQEMKVLYWCLNLKKCCSCWGWLNLMMWMNWNPLVADKQKIGAN